MAKFVKRGYFLVRPVCWPYGWSCKKTCGGRSSANLQ